MAKRAATNQLTADNWERDDEKEDGGVFQKASEEEIKSRQIKKAKRSILHSNGSSSSAQGGLFAGIKLHSTSLSFPCSTTSAGLPMAVAATTTSANLQFSRSLTFTAASQAPSFGTGLGMGGTDLSMGCTGLGTGTTFSPRKEDQFLKQLRLLNISVSKWITRHLQENPYVDLTPVFNDYFQHLREISKDEPIPPTSDLCKQTLPTLAPPTNTTPTFALTTGDKPLSSKTPPTLDTPYDNIGPSDDQTSQEEEEEDALDQPSGEEDSSLPQEEGKSKKQEPCSPAEDCLLSIRCKLYYKKESSFTDLGVGQLSVEERPSGVRLLLRNDTRLGKILLNVHLKGEVPVTQQKNNVLIVCSPNPPLLSEDNKEPITYLIRVKDVGLAQELHSVINKHL